jgi:RHS repeat-associated protein
MRSRALTKIALGFALVSLIVASLPPLPVAGTHGVDLMVNPPSGWAANVAGSNCAGTPDASSDYSCDGDDTQGGEVLQFCNTYTVHGGSHYACGGGINFTRSSGATSLEFNSLRFKLKVCTSGWPTFPPCDNSTTLITALVLTRMLSGVCDPFTEYYYVEQTAAQELDTGEVDFDSGPATVEHGAGFCWYVFLSGSPLVGTIAGYALEMYGESVANGDFGSDKPFGFAPWNAYSPQQVNLGSGNFVNSAEDLAMPGRLLGFSFVRSYNSADLGSSALGPAWTHSYNWQLTDNGTTVLIRRGDGRLDLFTRNPDLSYTAPTGIFDVLVKNPDTTYTLTLKNQVAFSFSTSGVLTRISEPAGNQINLSYTAGQLTTVTDTVGRAATLSYTGALLTQIQDPLGRKVTYAYDGVGRLITVTDKIGNAAGQNPALHQWHYAYDGSTRHLTTITDPDGRVRVTNAYDSQGRVYQQRDGLLNLTTFDFATPGQTVATDPRGHATTYTFDGLSREQTEVDVVGADTFTLTNHYDAAGNRDYVIDRRGNRTDFTYDARGNMKTKLDPLIPPSTRYLTQFDYDLKNNLTVVTDARGFTTTNAYQATTNVTLSTTAQITVGPPATYAITKWEYGDALNPGVPTKVISPRGNVNPTTPNYVYSQSLSYDTSGNLIQVIDADTNKTTFGYDGVGRQTTMIDPDGYAAGGVPAQHTWTTVYDENDRVKQTTDPLSHSAFTGYDGAGNRTSATDRNGNVTGYEYDDAARLQFVTQKPDPIGNPTLEYTTSVDRDLNGNATQVTQANGVITDYGYDALNRLTSVTTHPTGVLNLTTSYVLDGNGNATTRTAADGVATTYTYDELSRLKTVASSGLPTSIGYDYDELSHRKTMTDGTGTSTYSYDGLGRLTQAIQPNGTLGYVYDLDSNRTTLSYPTVGNVTYVFSPAGRLSNLTDWGSRVSTYTYTAAGLAKTVAVPGGMTTTYTYDNAQRLTTLLNATATATISSDTYTLDNEGNRTALDEVMNGIFASAKVNSDAGTVVQDHTDIGIGADAATYLLWDDARLGNADIEFAKRDPATGTWGANVKVSDDPGTKLQQNPAIALDSSNNAYAVWQDERNGANKADIYYSKRSAGPGTWIANVKVSDDPGASGGAVQRNPRIAGTSAGAETAVWVDLRSSQNNIYSSTLASGGSTWAVNKKITDNTAATKDFPDVTVGSDGTSYAVWQDSRNGNADIFFSTLASGGSNWAANVKISDETGSATTTKPRIGIDAAGNLLVAWIDARTSPARVRAARKPSGGAWSASVEVSVSPANAQSLALSVRSDGYAWATWGDTRAGSSNSDIWGSRYDPYLNTWSPPQRLDDATGTTAQLSPTVAFTATETMLSWRDNRLNANGDTQARRFIFLPGLSDHFAVTYDGLNRVTSVKGPVSETFVLDQASNIDTRTGPTQDFGYDTANRLTADGTLIYTWWDADRLKTRGADTFNYDALDRLKDATIASTNRTYAYNGDGLLQSRTQGTTTNFLWDPSSSLPRELKQGNDNIVYGLGPLYVLKADATTLTFARDGNKNVRAEVSSTGAVAAAFRYRAYGQTAQATVASPSYLGLASQLPDPSGLYYMRARWYEPTTGRFLTRDPLAADLQLPSTLAAYGYAGANPISRADPSGLRATVIDGDPVCQGIEGCSPPPVPEPEDTQVNTGAPLAGATQGPRPGPSHPSFTHAPSLAPTRPSSSEASCQQPDALTVGAGAVTSVLIVGTGVAFVAGGVALAGAGIAEAGATGGAGVLVTVVALHEAVEFGTTGAVLIAGGALVFNESVVRALQCGVR